MSDPCPKRSGLPVRWFLQYAWTGLTDTALYLQILHHLGQTRHPVFQHAHVAMEEDVDFGHVEGVKVVEQVPVHHVGKELEAV